MNRKDLINRLVARKLQLAGNAQASNVKICTGCIPQAPTKK
jgi:hypothetical protein